MPNTGVFEKAYQIVSRIPRGRVMTYGQVAALIGNPRLARRVGQAMFCAPPERGLPCHRVVKKDGSLPPERVFHGRQRRLLEEEGVTFLPDGRVDLQKCLHSDLPF